MKGNDFYIFRHGQTDLNVQQIWQGSGTDALLNDIGKEQAFVLANKIHPLHLTIYSSPLLRAVQTANILAKQLSDRCMHPITVLQDLRECHFGTCEGLTMFQAREKFGSNFVDEFLYPTKENWNLRFVGGESKQEVFMRVMNCLSYINDSLSPAYNNQIGVVCHAGVISALHCGLGLKNVRYDNCSILHLSYDVQNKKWNQIFD